MAKPSPATILRAIAAELQMESPLGDTDADAGVFAAHHAIRQRLLDIASDLDAHP